MALSPQFFILLLIVEFQAVSYTVLYFKKITAFFRQTLQPLKQYQLGHSSAVHCAFSHFVLNAFQWSMSERSERVLLTRDFLDGLTSNFHTFIAS